MSVEDDLKKLGETYRPRPAWQARVLREVERPHKTSVAWIVAPSLGALVVIGALLMFVFVQHRDRERADSASRAKLQMAEKANDELETKLSQIQLQQQQINEEKDQLISKLQAAKTPEDHEQINAQISENQRRAQAAADQVRAMQQQIKANTGNHPRCPPNDPLCGM